MKNSKELDLEHAKTEKLINDITYPLFIKIDKQKDEIARLNNIINELEKWLKENVNDKNDLYFQVVRKIDILDKLKDLKKNK